jgi:hypothetical protein
VLVIPGGGTSGEPGAAAIGVGAQLENAAVINWIRRTAAGAKSVLSVCNGAFLAHRAGLLEGLTATTTAGYIDYLASIAQGTKVVRDQRVVDNGKVVVTGGLSAGIDGALRVIENLEGHGAAVETALQMEYDWRPEDGWSRASLADLRVPQAVYGAFYTAGTRLLEFDAAPDRSLEIYETPTDLPSDALLRQIDARWDDIGWARRTDPGGRTVAIGEAADRTRWEVTVGVDRAEAGSAGDREPRQRVSIEVGRLGSAA